MPTPDRQHCRHRSRRAPAGRSRRLAIIVALCAAALAIAAPAQASLGHDLGELLLNQPCCSGAALQGSRSHILFPNSPQVGNLRQVLSLVAAQDDALQTNELGMTMDDNLVLNGDTSCFKPHNTVVSFYEWWDYVNVGTHCKALGQVSAGHLYSTAQQANNNFQFFIDGNPQLSSPLVQMGGTHAPNADNLAAGGEVTYDASVGGAEPVNWQASFGGNGNTPWQRFNKTQGWVTIQSNNGICNGAQNVCTGGGWSFSTGSFPTTWSVIH
jgi:hypothetical protein